MYVFRIANLSGTFIKDDLFDANRIGILYNRLKRNAKILPAIRLYILFCIPLINGYSVSFAQLLPPGGITSWEIHDAEEIVTFVIFNPEAEGISLPAGLKFISARDAQMPEIDEHLKLHPEHAAWAFSIIEITRGKAFIIDGREPILPPNGGIGLWFAPVDPSMLAKEIPKEKFDSMIAPSIGAVLGLGVWIPDRDYVNYMLLRGHHAEYGMVTLLQDSAGAFHGEIMLDDLHIQTTALPAGKEWIDFESGTQVLFAPGKEVENIVVIAGGNAHHRRCTADWSMNGTHPLSQGVILGPTFFTTYEEPLRGSAYFVRQAKKE